MRRDKQQRLPPCIPSADLHDGFDFTPDQDELNWMRCERAGQEIKLDAIREQQAWLQAQLDRLAVVAKEINLFQLRFEFLDLQERQHAWFVEAAVREKDQMTALMKSYQEQLDAVTFAKLKARVDAAGRDIAKTNARIEKAELVKRGVYKGRK